MRAMGLMRAASPHPIHEAAKRGDLESVRQILKTNPGQLNTRDKRHGHTPLHWAAHRGHASVVRYLLEAGAACDALTREGHTPLLEAAHQGHLAVVEALLHHGGCDPTLADLKHGATALHWAALGGHEAVVVRLLRLGPQLRDREGKRPEDWARRADHEPIARLLQQQRLRHQVAELIQLVDNAELLPLDEAKTVLKVRLLLAQVAVGWRS